jgi:hypothetical protein
MYASLFIAASVTFLVFAINGCEDHKFHESNSTERIQLLSTNPEDSNTNNAPAPLPILGAGTFWTYSRKLRNRIKKANEKV